MIVEDVDINILIASDYNPRAISDEEKAQIWQSIMDFGIVEPIVVNSNESRKNIIIGGHQRYYILKEMQMTKIPVFYINISDIEREKELNLRLNKNVGHWDLDKLKDFDQAILQLVGFNTDELEGLFAKPEESKDRLDELSEKKKIKCPECGHEFEA